MSDASQAGSPALSERSQRALARLQEIFQVNWVPDGLKAFAAVESGINDLYMNLNRHLQDGKYPRKEKLLVARDQLAGKEMNVGRYYLEKRNYTGAVNRFREVIIKYQTTRHVEEALMRLTEVYMAMGITNEAQTAAAVLGHNFPDSPWYKDAYALLQSGGLEPREDRGSYISRAFQGFTRTVGGIIGIGSL